MHRFSGNTDPPQDPSDYFLGKNGNMDCEDQNGLNIMNDDKCKTACEELGIVIEKLKNNRLCYVAGNNKCRQTGKPGAKVSRICQKKGIL